MNIEDLVNGISKRVSYDLDLEVLSQIINDIVPMTRPTNEVLTSFHIQEPMKEVINGEIEKFKNTDFDKLLYTFLEFDKIVIDSMNDENLSQEERYYKTTLGNSLMVVYLNEMIERLEEK